MQFYCGKCGNGRNRELVYRTGQGAYCIDGEKCRERLMMTEREGPEAHPPAEGKVFVLVRNHDGVVEGVRVKNNGGNHPLSLFRQWRDHSPDGFEWGYSGSGPAQLALSLLATVTRDKAYTLAQYQRFKQEVIARLPGPRAEERYGVGADQSQRITITEEEIRGWVINNPLSEEEFA